MPCVFRCLSKVTADEAVATGNCNVQRWCHLTRKRIKEGRQCRVVIGIEMPFGRMLLEGGAAL